MATLQLLLTTFRWKLLAYSTQCTDITVFIVLLIDKEEKREGHQSLQERKQQNANTNDGKIVQCLFNLAEASINLISQLAILTLNQLVEKLWGPNCRTMWYWRCTNTLYSEIATTTWCTWNFTMNLRSWGWFVSLVFFVCLPNAKDAETSSMAQSDPVRAQRLCVSWTEVKPTFIDGYPLSAASTVQFSLWYGRAVHESNSHHCLQCL